MTAPNLDGIIGDDEIHAALVAQRLAHLRANAEAKHRFDAESQPPIILPAVKNLDTLLAEPDNPTRYSIDKLAPAGGRTLLVAQYKAGKTTLRDNLIRALVDGEPFLSQFTVNTRARRLVVIDDELNEDTVRRWLRDQNIINTAAVADVVTLRGQVATFNLLDERCRAMWAARLRDLGCDYLILDCLRPILDALGLDESREVGRFLVPFDALLNEAGISDAFAVQHMGHANERARGDSRLQDWPDATWRIMRETDNPASARYFTAYGRDVDVPEGRLSYDQTTRHLTYAAGPRVDAKAEAAMPDVIDLLADLAKSGGEDGKSKNAIETALAGGDHSRAAIRSALNIAVRRGVVEEYIGDRRAKLHRIANPCFTCGKPRTVGQQYQHQSCAGGHP